MNNEKPFKAGFVQFDVKLGDVDSNLSTALDGLGQLGALDVKLAVLPEMWSCGFDNHRLSVHARKTPDVLDRLCQVALEYNMVIAGSMPEASDNGIFNTLYVVDSNGSLAGAYRKIHLFSLTDEDQFYAAGKAAVVCETSVGPLGLMTCYDLRFPELCRSLALKGAMTVVVPAQWPAVRIHHWDILLRARAIENQFYIVAANRCGEENNLVYGGHSQIVTPLGNVPVVAEDGVSVQNADIDFREISAFRNKIPCLNERVPGSYVV
ncbi:carbon-nitrogen family hydrolase [Thermodesulfobacteriota bacterium]